MIDKYKKGKRTYTRWDKKSEQVSVPRKKSAAGPPVKKPAISVEKASGAASHSNFIAVTSTREEFVLDFGFAAPGSAKVRIVSRVITSPAHAKKILKKLEKAVNGIAG